MHSHLLVHLARLDLPVGVADATSVARNKLENPKLLPGGDATELTVSAPLNQKSSCIEGIEKWPYGAAAIAFEAMPEDQLARGEDAWIDMDRNNGKITDIVVSCPLYCSICSTGISVTLVKSNAPNGGQNVYWANG
ncbi:hypothetical protein POTOM_022239 [Populus tomentosa]|uniref:Uncharacterized protein n=1 Tax=Populus tomentosa TaxID=118781 RepID=A0A8X8CT73_POPTO|nr:hypothetical protein POTOM_022239 [Populus tomentosa]